MKNAAVICEFDPLHRGHEYLLRSLREAGAERIVCVISGPFCQRGEPSVFSVHARARAALAAGADLVLELPFPYCCASAEFFAFGAVSVIEGLGGIDTLAFGSESGDAAQLKKAAEILSGEEFSRVLASITEKDKSIGAAKAHADAYEALTADVSLLCGANNVLALEYIKCAEKKGMALEYFTVARRGSAHGDMTGDSPFVSASYIRSKLRENADVTPLVCDSCAEIFKKEREDGNLSGGIAALEKIILSHFRLGNAESNAAECAGGLHQRMVSAAIGATNAESFFSALKTKKYTDARLRRAVVNSLCGVEASALKAKPTYTRLLAANEAGTALLSENKKTRGIKLLSNPSAISTLNEAQRGQFELARRAYALRALSLESVRSADAELCIPPFFTK